MNCTDVTEQLIAYVDGELPSAQLAEIDAHLADCPACRAELETLREEHTALAGAFRPYRARAEEITGRVLAKVCRPEKPRMRRGISLGHLASLLVAAAAGFLLALFVLPPRSSSEPRSVRRDVVENGKPPVVEAQLALATGPVEMAQSGSLDWFTCPDDAPLSKGTNLRTGPGIRCELSLPSGARVRLNESTVVTLEDDGLLRLEQGELWCDSGQSKRDVILEAERVVVTGRDTTFDVKHSAKSVEVKVLDGSLSVRGPRWQRVCDAPRRLQVTGDGPPNDEELTDPILATRWIHDLLVAQSKQSEELQLRIAELLEKATRENAETVYEEELRLIGAGCVSPIVEYLNSEDLQAKQAHRARAARLLADVADSSAIPQLIALLTDPNREVRAHAAAGLQRITGKDFGFPPPQWSAAPIGACNLKSQEWQEWWRNARKTPEPPGDAPMLKVRGPREGPRRKKAPPRRRRGS